MEGMEGKYLVSIAALLFGAIAAVGIQSVDPFGIGCVLATLVIVFG